MTTTKTFSEMLHGDIRWMKQQEAVNRMHRLGKTEMVLLDTEATYQYRYEYQHVTHFKLDDYIELITSNMPLMSALTVGMGYGKGMQAKRKMVTAQKVVADINKRHPALAAEHRVGGAKAERSIAAEMKRLREWKKMNWAYYYGMAKQWKGINA